MTRIYFYISPSGDNPVSKFIDRLEIKTQRKISRIFAHMREFGLGNHIQNIKKLSGTNLWEIKIISQKSVRIIYAVIYKKDILLLNGFVKKTQKTPAKEIKTSELRLIEWSKSKLLT